MAGMARQGRARPAEDRQAWIGKARHERGWVWLGVAWQAWHGWVRSGWVGPGMAGVAGVVRIGMAGSGYGFAWQAYQGMASRGVA